MSKVTGNKCARNNPTSKDAFVAKQICMVFILDGNLEYDAHVCIQLDQFKTIAFFDKNKTYF